MARPGRKPIPPAEKAARGTYRPDRDAGKVQLVVSNNGPMMPDWMLPTENESPLTVIARSIWDELLPKVTAMGIADCDSNLLARYCHLEANARSRMVQGLLPSNDHMTQLRQMEELLRIAGPKSRVMVGGRPPVQPVSNPFSRNGKAKAKRA